MIVSSDARMHPMVEFTLRWLPVLVWMAAIVGLPRLLSLDGSAQTSALAELIRGAIHVFQYGVLSLLVYRALYTPDRGSSGCREPDRRILFAAFGIAAGYGGFDELQQALLPGRQPSFLDLLVDALGSLLALSGIVITRVLRR